MTSKTRLWLGISLGGVAVAILVFFLFFYKARLTVLPTPATAEATLNGQPVPTGRAVKLNPGDYELNVKAAGFLATHQSLHLAISQIKNVSVNLTAIPTVATLTSDVQFPVLTSDEKTIVYLGNSGKQFFQVPTTPPPGKEAVAQAISNERFNDVENVVWSASRNLAVLQKKGGSTKLFDFKRYDLVTQEEKDLGADIRAITWEPSEKTLLMFVAASNGERTLVRRDVATSTNERLADVRSFPFDHPALDWSPDGKNVVIIENGIYLFNVITKQTTKLAGTDGAKGARWNPTSTSLVVELPTGLVVIPTDSIGTTQLGLATSIKKTVWSPDGKKIIVATSSDQNKDLLTEIDVASNKKSRLVYQSSGAVIGNDLIISSKADRLWMNSQGTLLSVSIAREDLTN